MSPLPGYRCVILGAGRHIAGGSPSALVKPTPESTVLDWIVSAFSDLPDKEVCFVSGYHSQEFITTYPNVHCVFNADWANSGPLYSLLLAPLEAHTATYVCYSDTTFRNTIVSKIEASTADVVICGDSLWKTRFERRSHADIVQAEKIRWCGHQLIDIGSHIDVHDSTAEFTGIIRLSPRAVSVLREYATHAAKLDTIPDALMFLSRQRLAIDFVDALGDWAELNAPQDLARFVLGTKAESLHRLKPLLQLGKIGGVYYFSHDQWSRHSDKILAEISSTFGSVSGIIRSSALDEDAWNCSNAGANESIPNVPLGNHSQVFDAVNKVFAGCCSVNPSNQILVQAMVRDVAMSGVVLTRTQCDRGPYYVINFDDSGTSTDSVTSGRGTRLRTLFIYRGFQSLPPHLPRGISDLIAATQEIERKVGHDSLDIEFAIDRSHQVHILQVRPIASATTARADDSLITQHISYAQHAFETAQPTPPFLLGKRTIFNVMSDWNPAEIIGIKPSILAFSLYRHLISDETWAIQRAQYGYRDVRPNNLINSIIGHPYINVRTTFNSFIPASISEPLAQRLVDYYTTYLASNPQLFDKVEFDVLFTCATFDYPQRSNRLKEAGFSSEEIETLRAALTEITLNGIHNTPNRIQESHHFQTRSRAIEESNLPPLELAYYLLEDVRTHGALAFSHLARNAFVAVAMLNSLETLEAITSSEKSSFMASLHTVSKDFRTDASSVAAGQLDWRSFVARYGHLRPGTYDICSPCYSSDPDRFLKPSILAPHVADPSGEGFTLKHCRRLTRFLEKEQFPLPVEEFELFLRTAIEGREFSKFVFTRNLSNALEALALFGNHCGFSREGIAHLAIQELYSLRATDPNDAKHRLQSLISQGQERYHITQAVCLPAQISSVNQFECYEQGAFEPSFITSKQVKGEVIFSLAGHDDTFLRNKIVVLQNADPGYDWILSQGITGFITVYGGANSHMAIRAAELQLPAAIGIGEKRYSELLSAHFIELNCAARRITPIVRSEIPRDKSTLFVDRPDNNPGRHPQKAHG